MTMPLGEIYGILLVLLFAVAAGLVGSFALMKRMLLASDVISHVALPGIALAWILHFNPIAGGAVTLFLGTFLIWHLQKRSGLATDAAIGVVFAGSLAIGAALIPGQDLDEAMFGSFQGLSLPAFLLGLVAVLLIIAAIVRYRDQLLLGLFSPELASTTAIRLDRLNLLFLMVFSLTVLVGLRFMGALLAGALVIVPATAARRLATDMRGFLLASCLISLLSVATGLVLKSLFFPHVSPGPIVAIVAAALFALTMLRSAP